MDFKDFLRLIARQGPVLLLVSAIAAAIVVAYTWNQPDVYLSKAVINTGVISTESVGIGDDDRTDRLTVYSQVRNMKEMLESRRVLSEASVRVLREHLLRGWIPPFVREAKRGSLLSDPDRLLLAIDAYLDSTNTPGKGIASGDSLFLVLEPTLYGYESVNERIDIEEVGEKGYGDLLAIFSQSGSPEESALMVRTVIDVFRRQYGSWIADEARSTREFFEKQTAQAQDYLAQLEDQMEQFKVENQIVNLGEQTSAILGRQQRLSELAEQQGQIIEARRAAVARTDNLLSNAGVRSDQLEQWRVSSEVVSLQNRLQDVQRALTRAQFADSRSTQSLSDSVASLRNRLDDRLGSLVQTGRSNLNQSQADLVRRRYELLIELDIARATRQAALDELRSVSPQLAGVARGGARLSRLDRELRLAEQEYQNSLSKLSLARSYESKASSTNIRVVEPALVPLEPEPSNQTLLVILAAFGTLLSGVIVLVGFEYFDTTLKSPQRIEAALGVPLLTAFPWSEPDPRKAKRRKSWRIELERARFQAAARALREAIIDGKGNIFLFTSIAREAGTSPVVRWAADALAQAHMRVAIVVFCRPVEEAAYQGIARHELPVLEKRERTWHGEEVILDSAQTILITAGVPGITALECAGEEAIRTFLRGLVRQVDVVLVDAPSMLGNTTGLELAPLVDQVVLVQPAEREIVPAQERILRRIRATAPSVLGVVTTQVREEYLEGIFGEYEVVQ